MQVLGGISTPRCLSGRVHCFYYEMVRFESLWRNIQSSENVHSENVLWRQMSVWRGKRRHSLLLWLLLWFRHHLKILLVPFSTESSLTWGMKWSSRDIWGFKHQLDVWTRWPLRSLPILRVTQLRSYLMSHPSPPKLWCADVWYNGVLIIPNFVCILSSMNSPLPIWTLSPGLHLDPQFGKTQCASHGTQSMDHGPCSSSISITWAPAGNTESQAHPRPRESKSAF